MNSSTTVTTNQFTIIQTYLTRYLMVPTYTIGNLGNIANIFLFSRHHLRLNHACVRYIIALSMANLVLINVGGISRSILYLNGFNPETASLIFCKFRFYFVQSSLLCQRCFVCLISIDRWMITSSNPSIRRWSTPKIANYCILIVTTMVAIFSVHAPIGYEIRFNLCYAYLNLSYIVFFSVYNILTAAVPIIVIPLFSILIIGHVHQSRQRVHGISSGVALHQNQQQPSRTDQQVDLQFIRLALIQSVSFTLLNIGFVMYVIYDAATSSASKSVDQRAVDAFLYGLSVHPIYIFSSVR